MWSILANSTVVVPSKQWAVTSCTSNFIFCKFLSFWNTCKITFRNDFFGIEFYIPEIRCRNQLGHLLVKPNSMQVTLRDHQWTSSNYILFILDYRIWFGWNPSNSFNKKVGKKAQNWHDFSFRDALLKLLKLHSRKMTLPSSWHVLIYYT